MTAEQLWQCYFSPFICFDNHLKNRIMDEKEKDFILSDSSQTNTKGFKLDVTGGRFERFDAKEVPLEERYLVLHPSHVTDLISLDTKGFKDITDLVNGQPKRFAGFGILQFSRMPLYDLVSLEKMPFGTVATADTGFCSFAFQANEVMKADGEVFMYSTENDPKERATIVGFDKRFIAVPIRNVGIGAIVSAKG